jgi:hypothetical protein
MSQVENNLRFSLRRSLDRRRICARVESVSMMQRERDEFAAMVIPNDRPDAYEMVLDLLTTPGCAMRVVRERVGRHDTRVYVEMA